MGCVETNCRYTCVGKGYQEQTQKNSYDNTCPLKLTEFFHESGFFSALSLECPFWTL